MSLQRIGAATRLNLTLQAHDPAAFLIDTAVPIMLTPFMVPGMKNTLLAEGYRNVNGTELAVPAFAILFAFFTVQFIVEMFFDERKWGTWDRLRVSSTPVGQVVAGKIVVALLMEVAQFIIVVAAAVPIDGYRIHGDFWALALTAAVFLVMVTLFGVAITLFANSQMTAISISVLIGMFAACVGGAITPVSTFPGWAKPIAKLSPIYWTLNAIERISLKGAHVGDTLKPTGIIVAVSVVLALLVLIGFHRQAKTDR
ncbi:MULTISPECIES: ABC transporter permease [unclassified Bifidobacterium]|uniref:ABC transporter permease n=1 Tax=unclassified Bifidobacterium TaxID=2608897 RepID=UPI0023F6CFB4|nr:MULTISPECIES: ABC transporter permease [unclassified Bifidobacterium]WEV66186.1 ABC transporter permease [Bifidobacterium sp. ESL0764]WEV75027.1 ABC transporter permease [Bifidobacterium sp. ESL0800]